MEIDSCHNKILADIPYALQGISSSSFNISRQDLSSISISLPNNLTLPELSLLRELSEPALLYSKIDLIISTPAKSHTLQSLYSAIKEELQGYLSLVDAIDQEIRSYLAFVSNLENESQGVSDSSKDNDNDERSLNETNNQNNPININTKSQTNLVTLKRCLLWLHDATLGLRLISSILRKIEGKKGGQILTALHFFTKTGDTFIRNYAHRLLKKVSIPFYSTLELWIYSGKLDDPFEEFFVKLTDQSSLWSGKYELISDLVPSFFSQNLAYKAYQTGKSLSFIRDSCGESDWVDSHRLRYTVSSSSSRPTSSSNGTDANNDNNNNDKKNEKATAYKPSSFEYSGDAANNYNVKFITNEQQRHIEQTIDSAYSSAVTHLISLIDNKFQLPLYLRALKKYLFLGQGDFVTLLLESLSPLLHRPANTLFRHNLTAALETAIRGSNAQFDPPQVLTNLDARMLELSHGEIGWDVFTLEYKVDSPLDVIVTPHASRQYLKIFNFLWRVRRVEYTLNSVWRRSTLGERGLLHPPEKKGLRFRRNGNYLTKKMEEFSTKPLAQILTEKLSLDWLHVRGTVAEMIHLITEIQYYFLYEVIEMSWCEFQFELDRLRNRNELTLDSIIQAHSHYLNRITHKGLLGQNSINQSTNRNNYNDNINQSNKTPASNSVAPLAAQLHEILKVVLSYADAISTLYSLSLEIYSAQERINNLRVDNSDYNKSFNDVPESTKNQLGLVRERLISLKKSFRYFVENLLGDLAIQNDNEMRFLGIRLNYNEFYSVSKRSRHRNHHTRMNE